jgi:hypothetical protein
VLQRSSWCQEQVPDFFGGEELCAIDAPSFSAGTCHGDSGGPLLAPNPAGSGGIEIGITSIGFGECSTERPDLFTRVDYVQSWVQHWIEQLAPPPPVAIAKPTPAPTPAPAAPVTATPAPPANAPGYYTDHTRTRKLVLHVAGDGAHIVGIRIKTPVTCQHGYEININESWLSYAQPLAIENHIARTTLEWAPGRETRRGTIGVYVTFAPDNAVEGRLRIHLPYRNHHVGLCSGTWKFVAAH